MKKNKPAFRDFQRKLSGEPVRKTTGLMTIRRLYNKGHIKDGDTYYIFNMTGEWSREAVHSTFEERKIFDGSYIDDPWFTVDPNFEIEGFTYTWK